MIFACVLTDLGVEAEVAVLHCQKVLFKDGILTPSLRKLEHFWSYSICFQCICVLMKILSHAAAKKKTNRLKGFEFLQFYGSFSSDIMAVKVCNTVRLCANSFN